MADGTPIWFERIGDDPDRAAAFYGAVTGWRPAPSPVAEHGGYLIASAPDGAGVAGLMRPPGPMPGGWLIYFAVADVAAAAARVAALGGAIHAGPQEIAQIGRFAYATDRQGIAFYLLQPAGNAPATPFAQRDDAFGHPVWIELAAPDPAGAFDFYGSLFGWTQRGGLPMGEMGEYAFIGTRDDACPGAIMSSAATGAPARWNWYVQVPDIDTAVAAAQRTGGALLQGPDPIPGGSFSANVADAQGHAIGLVGPRR